MSKLAGKNIAIVGAGPAGLAAALEMLARNAACRPVIFETRSNVGGIWQHEENPGPCLLRWDARGKPYSLTGEGGSEKLEYRQGISMDARTPIYEGLRTNITCDLMAYRDDPFEEGTALFPSRSTVQSYLEAFAERHDLLRYVRLSTRVDRVRRITNTPSSEHGEGSSWEVCSTSLASGDQAVEYFDYIVCASGRCNVPSLPTIPGLHHFPGSVLHSAWYRHPTDFAGKRVLVVGHASSGMDIARELSGKLARQFRDSEEWVKAVPFEYPVRQSIRNVTEPPPMDYDPLDPASPEWARRIQVVPQIKRVTERGALVLDDGQELTDVDVLIFATGYLFSYPYLDHGVAPFDTQPVIPLPASAPCSAAPPSDKVIDTLRVSSGLTHLDDWQLFHRDANTKSIVFLGLPSRIISFPFSQTQSRFAAAFWDGASGLLPQLDTSIPVTDPARWLSRAPVDAAPTDPSLPQNWTFERPSDSAYSDALLALLPPRVGVPAGARAEWDLPLPSPSTQDPHAYMRGEELLQSPEYTEQYDHGALAPRGQEGDTATAAWRRLRRIGGRTLRRATLGY